ncbi:MAG: PilZ domain-containing protein [Holophagales bacterium]|nr:PilZ domain-containing protein [Holophagales bacterium]
MNRQDEFPLNVEAAKTAPYASTVVSVDQANGQVLLRMIRPMPAQLPPETPCKAAISALGEHWKATLLFQGRVGHLQYLFDLPKFLEKAARREHKRYRFRPRENVSVYVQDSSFPGIAAVGQLVDLSQGGLAFRPERAFRVEDKVRLALSTALFEKGKSFPIIRVDGLREISGPLKLRGIAAYVGEQGSIITAAFVFGLLDPEAEQALGKVLEMREKIANQAPMMGSVTPMSKSGGPALNPAATLPEPSEEPTISPKTGPETRQAEQEQSDLPPTTLRLARRATNLLLVKHGGEECDKIISVLKDGGFVRIEHCESFDSHLAQTIQNVDALLVGLEVGGDIEAPLDSFRKIHEKLKSRKEHGAMVLSDRFEPILTQLSQELSLPLGFTRNRNWIEIVDKAAKLV